MWPKCNLGKVIFKTMLVSVFHSQDTGVQQGVVVFLAVLIGVSLAFSIGLVKVAALSAIKFFHPASPPLRHPSSSIVNEFKQSNQGTQVKNLVDRLTISIYPLSS